MSSGGPQMTRSLVKTGFFAAGRVVPMPTLQLQLFQDGIGNCQHLFTYCKKSRPVFNRAAFFYLLVKTIKAINVAHKVQLMLLFTFYPRTRAGAAFVITCA